MRRSEEDNANRPLSHCFLFFPSAADLIQSNPMDVRLHQSSLLHQRQARQKTSEGSSQETDFDAGQILRSDSRQFDQDPATETGGADHDRGARARRHRKDDQDGVRGCQCL